MRKVVISSIHFGAKQNTVDFLVSLEHLSRRSVQIDVVIIDNNAKESFSNNAYKAKNFKLTVLENKENLGFAGGHNVGIRYALNSGADYVLVVNNDTIVDKGLVEELVSVAEENKEIGVVAPKIYFAKGFEFHKGKYTTSEEGKVFWYAGGITDWRNIIARHRGVDEVDHGQYNTIEETDFASGCCMLIKKEIFGKVGLFDEKYFLYYEDSDLCERIKQTGYKIMYSPKAILWHKNASSAGGSGSFLQDYYISRNRMIFGMKYAPARAKIALFKESLILLTKGRKLQKQGIADFYLRK
ncbi:MAG: glycosyltransferase family 2 protein, partial [Candidatus Levybacteria bacterium]|nr:glycosyltransferase family 2 protein [Candidatus Levybacteria bacterium]